MASKKPSARKTSMKAKSEPNAQPRPKAKPSPKTADKKVGKPRGKSMATAKKAQGANSARGKARSQAGPQSKPKAILDDATLLGAWRDMVEIRRFEERAGQLYAMGKIGGFCHLYIGQEAVAVGMQLCVNMP